MKKSQKGNNEKVIVGWAPAIGVAYSPMHLWVKLPTGEIRTACEEKTNHGPAKIVSIDPAWANANLRVCLRCSYTLLCRRWIRDADIEPVEGGEK